jgi:hypothetical protein
LGQHEKIVGPKLIVFKSHRHAMQLNSKLVETTKLARTPPMNSGHFSGKMRKIQNFLKIGTEQFPTSFKQN